MISPDGKEMFWMVFVKLSEEEFTTQVMHTYVDENGKWTEPGIPAFAKERMTSEHLFSPDGKKLFFYSVEGNEQNRKTKYVEKTDSGWSEPKADEFYLKPSLSFTRSGAAYFSGHCEGKPWNSGIFCAQYSDSGYTSIQALDAVINSPFIDYTPWISPEGDYLMFTSSRPSAEEKMFLHISFKNRAGTWSTPQRMNEKISFSGQARFPSISPDEKYIFFCGDDGNIYWVSRDIVKQFQCPTG